MVERNNEKIVAGIVIGVALGLAASWLRRRSGIRPFPVEQSVFVEAVIPGCLDKCRGCKFYDLAGDSWEQKRLVAAGISIENINKPRKMSQVAGCDIAKAASYTVRRKMDQPGIWLVDGRRTEVCPSYECR